MYKGIIDNECKLSVSYLLECQAHGCSVCVLKNNILQMFPSQASPFTPRG